MHWSVYYAIVKRLTQPYIVYAIVKRLIQHLNVFFCNCYTFDSTFNCFAIVRRLI